MAQYAYDIWFNLHTMMGVVLRSASYGSDPGERRSRSVITVTHRDARYPDWLRDELGADARSWFPRFDRGVIRCSGPTVVEISDRVWATPNLPVVGVMLRPAGLEDRCPATGATK